MGISILDACMFDVPDTLVQERQWCQFKNGEFTGGTGPSQKAAIDKKRGHVLKAADLLGENIVRFVTKS